MFIQVRVLVVPCTVVTFNTPKQHPQSTIHTQQTSEGLFGTCTGVLQYCTVLHDCDVCPSVWHACRVLAMLDRRSQNTFEGVAQPFSFVVCVVAIVPVRVNLAQSDKGSE